MTAVDALNTHVIHGEAVMIQVKIVLDEGGQQVQRLVGTAQGEDVGVAVDESRQPLEAAVVVGRHVIVEIKTFGDFRVLDPRKYCTQLVPM